ncbi:MAG: hypothetical protein A3E78_16555 [Alphaproteobacteria bacterium RIFCSPHIGHO2_12_FULL_63_12]|nr:MAG: hypothetical protein A3E78_16555 [Alphaproteobacteria bacterium RIFCSPHIGHO2_12_FULL_63_12]
MKAAVIHEQGGPDVLVYEEIPDPRPADDEVVLDVSVISLEGGDLLNRRILPVEKFPHVIGYAAAGHIAEIGKKVTGLNVGQRVAAFNFSGSHAEKFRAPANYVFPVPLGLDLEIAATFPVAYGTAGWALFEAGGLKRGETVFIQGASGGVGTAAAQLASAAGAIVIGTGLAKACGVMRANGCDHAIAHDRQDFAQEIATITKGRGVDLIVDLVGGDAAMVSKLISTAAYRGRLAVVGLASGEAPSVAFWDIVPKNMTIHGVLFGAEMHSRQAHAMMDDYFKRATLGELTMTIDRRFALADAAAAHRYVEEKRPAGRVLIIP